MENWMKPMDLAKRTVDLGRRAGVDDVICVVIDSERRQIRFANNQITVSKAWFDRTVKLYVAKDRRIITSEEKVSDYESLSLSLKRMVENVKLLREIPGYTSIPKGPFRYPSTNLYYDKRVVSDEDKLFESVEVAINSAIENGGCRVSGVLIAECFTRTLVSTGGIEVEEKGTRIAMTVRAFADEKGEAQGMGVTVSRRIDGIDPEGAGKEAGQIARDMLKTVKAEPGTYDAVLGPYFVANLLSYCAYLFSAFFVDMGVSPFVGKLGQRIASEKITVIDDPHLPDGYNSHIFDDEGYPTQRNFLIKEGVLKTYVHNGITAKKFGVNRTGNAGWEMPLPWNIVIREGDRRTEELIEDLQEGFYFLNTWYTRFQNYITGDFSTIPRDGIFYVKNGEIVGSVRGVRVAGNIIKLFEDINGVSREIKQVYWWETPVPVLSSTISVRGIKVTKAYGA